MYHIVAQPSCDNCGGITSFGMTLVYLECQRNSYIRPMDTLFEGENQIISIIVIAISLLFVMGVAIVLFFYFSRRKIIKTELEKATMEIEHQKEVLRSTIITQEEERARIAQDMHDAISSKLNIVSLNANFLLEEGITSDEANKMGDSILKVTTTVLESSRRIAHDLLPPTLQKFGLEAALEELCEEVYDSKKFELEYDISYEENFVSSNHELHIFRIVQELMNNSIKHSEASQITLILKTKENILSLQYRDNGKGFNIEDTQKAKGLGMSGIENRAVILQGDLEIASSPGNGIAVTIEINNEL